MPGPVPPRRAVACGALGGYDRERVASMARALGPDVSVAHEQPDAMLMLDRPPIRWSARRRRGFAWSERVEVTCRGKPASWSDAATGEAACGLVVGGRQPFVHTSVSGVAPVYWLEERDAVYFCSRIDPLIAAADGSLSADWEAWASILTLGHPLGDRTPFTGVRRLPPFATLERQRGRARVSEERWPWAEVEPVRGVEDAAGDALARLREVVDRLPAGPLACPLSGGWDSRILLGLLARERGADVFCVTTSIDDGTDLEERCAANVAAHVGVPHETVAAAEGDFARDLHARAAATDYQLVSHPWMAPLIARLEAEAAPVIDGLGLDTLAQPGGRIISRDAAEADGRHVAARELWSHYKGRGMGGAYRHPLARALRASARRQLFAESRRFAGHPARALLTLYRTRTMRGISLTPDALMGGSLAVATPFTDDATARAVLSASPRDKFGARFHAALFAQLDPKLGALPSTNDGLPRETPTLPRRQRSATAAAELRRLVEDSPLDPFLSPRMKRPLVRDPRDGEPRAPAGAFGPAMFAQWHRRYRDRLREVDPGELLAG